MANNSPTLVMASLSDDQLKKSIDSLVTHVDEAMKKMVQSTNNAVGEMEAKLKSLGNLKIDSGGSADGGASKRTKAQNAETDAVEKTITARGKQIKQNQETAMSFDQIAAALDKARRTVSDFNTKRASGILPSSDDYKRYEQALARIVEYNDKLKQSALAMADANQKAFAFDGKGLVKDFFSVDERLKQLNQHYKEEEKSSQKATAAIKENTQAKKENANVGQPAKSARDSYIAFMQGYKQQAEQIRSLMEEEQKAMQQRRQGVVDGFTKTIEERKARVKELSEEISKLYKERPDGYRDAIKQRTEEMNALKQKIRELTEAQKNLADSPIGASNRFLELEKEYNRIKNMMIDTTNVQRQSTQETEKQTQSAQRYTEEIRKQAQAIRESEQWKKTGDYGFIINEETGKLAWVTAKDRRSIEEQLVSLYREESGAVSQVIQLENVAKDAARERLGTERQITEEVEKRGKKYVSPTINDDAYQIVRNAIARKLGIEQKDVIGADAQYDSIKRVNNALKQLQDAYTRMSNEERNSPIGQHMIRQMQELERQTQQLRAQMSRPISLKDAMGLSEKTLDDIAYKMQRLSSYRSGLNVETQTKEIDQVNRKYAELQKKMNEVMAKNSQMASSNNILANSWRYMRNRLAFYLTVRTGTTLVRDLARVRSEYEMNEKALGTLLNSAERGTRIFNELSNMALVSPYTLIELSAAAKQLTAYDIAAKDVVDTTRRLADISAAVGVPVERLTYALGQVKAYGHLMSQDARQFLNAGVPLVKELANRYSELEGRLVSTADVYDRMKKHAISYNDVLSVLTSMTDEGGHFFDYQAKMAETLKVRLANLSLAYNNMLNDMGKANGGAFTTGIKGLTQLLKHWRKIERILGTVVVGIGAYRTAVFLAGLATTTYVGKNAFGAWLSLARGVKSAKDATALFSLTVKSIPFAGWATAIASLVSYFVLFNNSSDETKQKLQDIATAFEGIRKEATDLFADAISTDSLGTQLTKLKDMLELAETELGITIPVNIEDVNESNVKQKLRETKNTIDNYVNFSQTFSEAAVDTRFNESMTDFGTTARSVYTSVTESVNSVKVALQELVDAGKASERDIEILKELDNKPKDGESRIEYFQRLVKLYEELGLIGEKKVETKSLPSAFGVTITLDDISELVQNQEKSLDRLGLKNKTVFETMLSDVQGYYSKSSFAAEQFEQQVERVAKSVDIFNKNIPIEERTAKLEVAINQEAAKNNWNEYAIQYAKWVANQKYGLNITISEESKKDSGIELSDWQKRMQSWADKNGIKFSLNFIEKEDEKAYADRMLQAAKDAQAKLDIQRRKLRYGTGSQAAVDAETENYKNARTLALKAGAYLSSLNKERKQAESELSKAIKDELSTIDKVRSIYKDLTKEGMSHADAVERATGGWDETVNAINKVLQKNGLQKLDLSKFAGIENPRELVNMLQSQLNTLLKSGAKPAEIKELQTKIQTLKVDADKYDLTRITKGLNSELDKLKDEYELALELDADPELGNMFTDMFGIDTTDFPKTIDEYMSRAQQEFDKMRKKRNFSAPLNIFKAGDKEWEEWGRQVGLVVDVLDENGNVIDKNTDALDKITPKFKEAQGVAKKWATDTVNNTKKLEYKLAELNDKIAIKEKEQAQLHEQIEKEKNEVTKHYLNLTYQSNEKAIDELRAQALSLMPEYARVFNSIAEYSSGVSRRLQRDLMRVFDEAKYDSASGKWTLTGSDGKQTILNDTQYRKEREKLTREMRKSQAPFKKIKEAFKPSDKNGVVDYAKGIELVSAEVQKLGSVASEVGNLAQIFGADEQTVEIINDVATSLNGVATAGQGISQIASGDYIGGAASLLSGITSIIGAWADNDNKRIDAEIKNSEREIKKLQIAYVDLENEVNKAYGTSTIGAKKALIANKELQLAELKRQLMLEELRDSKDKDEDKILDLQKQIKELEYDIKDSTDEIINDLLGISSVGDAMDSVMDGIIEALRKGEDAMAVFDESIDNIIANMIKKMYVTKVLLPWFEDIWDEIAKDAGKRIDNLVSDVNSSGYGRLKDLASKTTEAYVREWGEKEREYMRENAEKNWGSWASEQLDYTNYHEYYKSLLRLYESGGITTEDIKKYAELLRSGQPVIEGSLDEIDGLLTELGLVNSDASKQLSALQQGITQISEPTANAIEAYMNIVAQRVFEQNLYLQEIRDHLNNFDLDVQLGTLSQMLLQLQQSYQVQQNIESILTGVLNPSGRAIVVELNS